MSAVSGLKRPSCNRLSILLVDAHTDINITRFSLVHSSCFHVCCIISAQHKACNIPDAAEQVLDAFLTAANNGACKVITSSTRFSEDTAM